MSWGIPGRESPWPSSTPAATTPIPICPRFGEHKGWDFVDDDDDPRRPRRVLSRAVRRPHGTHVAGTIAANGMLKGVAPNVRLLAYRVLGPEAGVPLTDVLAGIERAVLTAPMS